jgi:hypothetical protein
MAADEAAAPAVPPAHHGPPTGVARPALVALGVEAFEYERLDDSQLWCDGEKETEWSYEEAFSVLDRADMYDPPMDLELSHRHFTDRHLNNATDARNRRRELMDGKLVVLRQKRKHDDEANAEAAAEAAAARRVDEHLEALARSAQRVADVAYLELEDDHVLWSVRRNHGFPRSLRLPPHPPRQWSARAP